MRTSNLIIATLCCFAAAIPFNKSLAAESSAPVADTDVVGTCETTESLERFPDAAQTGRTPEEESKPEPSRNPIKITDEMKERADFDLDGSITVADMALLLAGWGNCPAWSELSCQGDINLDGAVDYADLAVMLQLLDAAGPIEES